MPPKEKYSDPKLRDEIKEELKASDKGGAPGQWSARKAQMMAKEYKDRGGSYNTDKSQKDKSQQNLSNWTEEEWQTKDGHGEAKDTDGTQHRYLPKKAWEKMDEKEKDKTDEKKVRESKKGKQFVANTGKARQARKDVSEQNQDESGPRRSKRNQGKKSESPQPSTGQKRGRSQKAEDQDEASPPSKSQKSTSTVGSKHDKAEAPAQQASKSRMPKKGQLAYWKAMPGWVDGKVVEILKADRQVEGKQVRASEDDPRVVLKSNAKSGKICVHKIDNIYFD